MIPAEASPVNRETLHKLFSQLVDVQRPTDERATQDSDGSVSPTEDISSSSPHEWLGPEIGTAVTSGNMPSKLTTELTEEELSCPGPSGTHSAIEFPESDNGTNTDYGTINSVDVDHARHLDGHDVQGLQASPRCAEQDFQRIVEEEIVIDEHQGKSAQDWLGPEPSVTTLMLKNIPCRLTRENVTEELRELGFAGLHDAMHIPSRSNGSNKGYGFINFVTADVARRAADTLNGHMFKGTESTKLCQVTVAAFQGRDATLKFAKMDLEPKTRNAQDGPAKVVEDVHTQQKPGSGPITTLMLSNIPRKLTTKSLEKELRHLGFSGTYDVLHIAVKAGNPLNEGYGFINFLSAHVAHYFVKSMNGYVFPNMKSAQACKVSFAAFQGREASLNHIRGFA
eukprot:TRINITY_DN983_c0_g1_i1.p1 TRINITY_DN983_c0_g1~~TRINITY_DN983_c0_g1_i1.p1  ORF type:complete len:396 (-),score=44.08 TRINITY_DN983_c0_g1_i1:258-1445(-)